MDNDEMVEQIIERHWEKLKTDPKVDWLDLETVLRQILKRYRNLTPSVASSDYIIRLMDEAIGAYTGRGRELQ